MMQTSQAHRIRVVLAEDHTIVREALASLLGGQPDMELVGAAADGHAAVALARRTRPDVVVMDVSMPGGNGVEATRQLKAELPQVHVIGLSAHEDQEVAAAMEAAGATIYVSKADSADLLLDAIRLCAGRSPGTSG